MRQNKALHYLSIVLIILALISLFIWLASIYLQPLLSSHANRNILLMFSVFSGILGVFASLNDIIDLVQKIFLINKNNPEILNLNVEKAVVKFVQKGYYWAQISLIFNASEKDVYLKQIRLKAPNSLGFTDKDSPYGENGLPITYLLPYQEQDILCLVPEKFHDNINLLKERSIKVQGLLIPKNSYLSISLIGVLNSERLPDGWEDLPLENWHFLIEYGDAQKTSYKFSFTIHASSPTRPVNFEYYGFSGRSL